METELSPTMQRIESGRRAMAVWDGEQLSRMAYVVAAGDDVVRRYREVSGSLDQAVAILAEAIRLYDTHRRTHADALKAAYPERA